MYRVPKPLTCTSIPQRPPTTPSRISGFSKVIDVTQMRKLCVFVCVSACVCVRVKKRSPSANLAPFSLLQTSLRVHLFSRSDARTRIFLFARARIFLFEGARIFLFCARAPYEPPVGKLCRVGCLALRVGRFHSMTLTTYTDSAESMMISISSSKVLC